MNGQKMLIAFSYIDRKLIAESEQSAPVSIQKAPRPTHRSAKHVWLIAAAVALMLLLVGCGVLYVLRLQDMKIGEEPISQALPSDSPSESTTLDVISLQGIQGSPTYLAAQEWLSYTQGYTPSGGDYWESDPEYWAYSVQNQEMVDKLNAICEKYGLKIIGKPWHEQIDCTPFLALLGVDRLLKPNADAALSIPAGRFFPGGSFTIYGTLTLSGAEYPFTYHCVKKDVFCDVFGYLEPSSVSQQNYTTANGVNVLLLKSSSSGMILVDRENQFLTLGIDGDAPLEQIAECFDFTIHPNAPDAAAADAREQASQEEMRSRMGDLNILPPATYAEYVADLIQGDEMNRSEDYTPPVRSYTFYDLDGNGTDELLIFSDDLITSVVGMKDGLTNEGKVYSMYLCDGNVLVDYDSQPNALGERWYHIFRFANDGDPVFSNPKEQSIVRLKQCKDGTWWRTSSTDHYAEFDTEISEEEAMEILNSYKPVELQTRPLTQFEEP